MFGGFNGLILMVVVGLIIGLPIVIGVNLAKRHRQAVERGDIAQIERYNVLAVVGFVLTFITIVPGIVLAHVSLAQIRRTRERGWGLATAALIIGYWLLAVGAIVAILMIVSAVARG